MTSLAFKFEEITARALKALGVDDSGQPSTD